MASALSVRSLASGAEVARSHDHRVDVRRARARGERWPEQIDAVTAFVEHQILLAGTVAVGCHEPPLLEHGAPPPRGGLDGLGPHTERSEHRSRPGGNRLGDGPRVALRKDGVDSRQRRQGTRDDNLQHGAR